MITVARLKELLEQVPDTAKVYGYEGEGCGIVIYSNKRRWWISAGGSIDDPESYTEGFANSPYTPGLPATHYIKRAKHWRPPAGYKDEPSGIVLPEHPLPAESNKGGE